MDDWGLIRSIVMTVTTVTTVAATVGVGLMFGSLRTLRDTAGDLRNRVSDLEKERAEDKAEKAELETENRMLKTMVMGKVEWVALTDQLEAHHRETIVFWRKAEDQLTAILTEVTS